MSERLENGFAQETPVFFSDLERLYLSPWIADHSMKEKKSFTMKKCYVISLCDTI